MVTCEFPVDKWNRLQRELVWIRRAVIEKKHQRLTYQPQGRIAAWRLIKGRARFRLSSGDRRLKAGDWIFPGMGTGERSFSDGTEFISVRFRMQWPGDEQLFDHRQPIIVRPAAAAGLDQAAFALAEFVQGSLSPDGFHLGRASVDVGRYLTLQTHVDDWLRAYVESITRLGHTPRQAPRVDDRIQEAVRLMESQLQAGAVMTENTVARSVGLSLSQFKRLFGRDLKKTPKAWLDDFRYELACDRLSETGQTIKQIGYGLGFRSPSHFSAWFTRRRGGPPGRAAHGNADRA